MKNGNFKELINFLEGFGSVITREPMKDHTSFRTGGPADIMVMPWGVSSVPGIVKTVAGYGVPLTVIGGGSNLLVGDDGIRGVVLKLGPGSPPSATMKVLDDGSIYCGSWTRKEEFIAFAVNSGFGGVEFMAGIPGCMGGGIIMNAGTFMGSFSDILEFVDAVGPDGDARRIKVEKSMSSYRRMDLGDIVAVTGAVLKLPRCGDADKVRASIKSILEDRKNKHPLDFPSAGSVFKNPEGHSSWKLINDAGLKGRKIGGAAVSELHTNFIINTGGATSSDIRGLIALIQETVSSKFGIDLENEIRMIGDFK
ncbi:MAG: UDP-N-acetylmuramate dehydrogenase [Spirochaetes bacterium]|jgi:UDP-N-acetylmuramate dehydrogenase|nr:UDP-N-acetylmuramate dehydrogenase [Spirochaetota bacterium]